MGEHIFLDDHKNFDVLGINIKGKTQDFINYIENSDVFVAIGNNEVHAKLFLQLESQGANFPTLIHPSAVIGKGVNVDKGTVVMAGVVINSDTNIGKGCIINTGATIDHDCKIKDFVHISPGVNIAGSVTVGRNKWTGIGSSIVNNVTIHDNCIIGAGSLVLNSIMEKGTYYGIPVRRKL